ncbi:hypothetical protein ACLMJK_000595 [Lecanora helva]
MAAAVGAWLNLVGPATTAATKIISLSSQLPAVSNLFGGADPAGAPGNVVNVGIGMFEGGDQDDFGGSGLQVSGFTSQGTYIAQNQFDHMHSGVTAGMNLGKKSSPEAFQLTITAGGSDAVCVQFVELGWEGTITSGFDGTWGRDCGQDWYYSTSTWGQIDGIPYRPDCFWFDSGKGAKHPLREIWVDMEKMVAGAPVSGKNSSTQTYCNDQAMKFSSSTVSNKSPAVADGLTQDKQGNGPGPGVAAPSPASPSSAALSASPISALPRQKREAHHPHLPPGRRDGVSTGSPVKVNNATSISGPSAVTTQTGSYKSSKGSSLGSQQVLVISDIQKHSAEELCASDSSHGPDFVSKYENKFCDMETKTIHPLCDGSLQTECFDIDQNGKKLRKRGGMGGRITKEYGKIQSWTGNEASSVEPQKAAKR